MVISRSSSSSYCCGGGGGGGGGSCCCSCSFCYDIWVDNVVECVHCDCYTVVVGVVLL